MTLVTDEIDAGDFKIIHTFDFGDDDYNPQAQQDQVFLRLPQHVRYFQTSRDGLPLREQLRVNDKVRAAAIVSTPAELRGHSSASAATQWIGHSSYDYYFLSNTFRTPSGEHVRKVHIVSTRNTIPGTKACALAPDWFSDALRAHAPGHILFVQDKRLQCWEVVTGIEPHFYTGDVVVKVPPQDSLTCVQTVTSNIEEQMRSFVSEWEAQQAALSIHANDIQLACQFLMDLTHNVKKEYAWFTEVPQETKDGFYDFSKPERWIA